MAARIDLDRLHELVTTTRLTTAQIADQLGCSRRQVERYKERWGRTHPANEHVAHRVTEERLTAIADLINEGYPHHEIAKRLHVHWKTIDRHFPGTSWTRKEVGQYARMMQQLEQLPTTLDAIRRKQNQALAA